MGQVRGREGRSAAGKNILGECRYFISDVCYRRNKVVNHFSIMLQKRFREQERGDDEEDEGEKSGKKKKKGGGRGGDLRIHDLEDDLEMSSDDSDSSMGDGEEREMIRQSSSQPFGVFFFVCLFILFFLIFRSLLLDRWRAEVTVQERHRKRKEEEEEKEQ